jgi:hypothetical protein
MVHKGQGHDIKMGQKWLVCLDRSRLVDGPLATHHFLKLSFSRLKGLSHQLEFDYIWYGWVDNNKEKNH